MTGKMSPEERYLRSILINQVCTGVVRHCFDGLHPPTNLVQYLLDQRTRFETEEKKIPNYQWIQLYPEVLFRADVHIAEKYIDSYDRKDLKDYKAFTDRISKIFTCLFDSVDGDQKVKVVNLSRLESGEVLATLEITSQYNSDDIIIQQALEVPVNSVNVDASLKTIPDGFTFAKQGVSDTYRMEVNLTKVNAADIARKDTKEFRIMAKKLERILLLLFDPVPGTQSVEVEEFRFLASDCATAICNVTSENHKDDKRLEEAISIPNSEGRLGKTLKTTCTPHGFSFKEVIVFETEINVKEKFSKTLENSYSNEFKAFAIRVQPIIKGLYDSVTGDQDVEIVKCRQGSSDTVLVLFHLISHENNDEEGLRAVTESKIRTESISLSYGITDDGFSFETNKCMFEVKLRLAERYSDSKELANPKSEAFKSFKEKVQPEILRLYESVCGSQEIDILRYKIESSGAVHSITFKLASKGCSDESKLKEPLETQIQTGLLGSCLKVCATDLHFQKLTETVFYQVTLNVKKPFTDELKKKHSADYLAFSKFVQTVLRTQYEKVPGKQEFDVVECQRGPSGTNSTVVIIDVISKGCTNNVYMELCQPVKNLITLGKFELALTTSLEDFSFRIIRGSKPVSSKCFDLSLLITLLRKDSNVKQPKNGFDVLPSKDDISDGAQIATIKHYRNELAHASEAKMSEHMFDDTCSKLKNAINNLAKGDTQFARAVNNALTMNLDNSTEEMLIKMVQHDKTFLDLDQEIEKLKEQAKQQSASTQAEINCIKEEITRKEELILKNRTDFQTLNNQLQRTEKKYDEKFRVLDERKLQQDEKNRNMDIRIQENRLDIQRQDTQNERKRNLIDQTESRIRKFMEDTKETFVETETQKKVLKILESDNCLVMISKGGRGKTALGLQLASFYKDKEFTPMYVVNNEIETMRDIIDFRSKNFIIVDDLFGQTNSNINDHILRVIYDSVKSENCQSKVILNIRESPGCNKSILESHSILRETQVINLDDKTYDLSREEKEQILLKYMKKLNVSLCDCKEQNICEESVYTDAVDLSLTVCKSTVEEIIECQTLEGFPEACHMFCSDKTLTVLGLLYFKNTREQLVTTMKNLCAEGFDEHQQKYQYSTLVYVALKGNIDLDCLDENLFLGILSFYEEKDKKIKKKLLFKAVYDMSLNGKYLVKGREGEAFVFQHATVCEAVLISYGEECPEDLLSKCSASFFQEYIRPDSYRNLKKKNHVYLFVSDEVLSNNLLALLVKRHKFMSAYSKFSKLMSAWRTGKKMAATEKDNSHSTSNNYSDLDEDPYIKRWEYYENYTDLDHDPYNIDRRLNPMHHRSIGHYLFEMGVRFKLYSFVNLFLLNLSERFLETATMDQNVMKFFFDGLTCRGKRSEAVSIFPHFCNKYLFKYGGNAVILSFCRPSTVVSYNETCVLVHNTLLVKKMIEQYFQSWKFVWDEYDRQPSKGSIYLDMIVQCLHVGQPHVNGYEILQDIGNFLCTIMNDDHDFVKLIMFQLINISKQNVILPYLMRYLLDGLTDCGKNCEVISTNSEFWEECLFKYGSTEIILSLCRPSSFIGSDQGFVKVDTRLLANKLIEYLKYAPENYEVYSYKYVRCESWAERPSPSNIRYYFFQDDKFYDKKYLNDIGRYIFRHGVKENDAEFIKAVINAMENIEDIEEKYIDPDNCLLLPIMSMKLDRTVLKQFSEYFSYKERKRIKRTFPKLIDCMLILYDFDDLPSDSEEENVDSNNTEPEDDGNNEV